MTLYRDVIASLLEDCRRFRSRQKDLDSLKAAIWNAAQRIVALENCELRGMLQQAEAELDSIQFTNDRDAVFGETLKVLKNLETTLQANLQSSP